MKNLKYTYSLIILVLASIFFPKEAISQAAAIVDWRNSDQIYCVGEDPDTLIGASPSGKPFYYNGESYTTSAALTRLSNGVAIFYPSLAGIGVDTITYGTIGSHDVTMIVTITTLPVVSLSPFSSICVNSGVISLFNADSSNTSPKTGTFSGAGVDANNNFNPATAGVGNHTITYTVGVGGCSTSATQNITVLPNPTITYNPFPNVCENDAPLTLSYAVPAGGTYSGTGVSGNTFSAVTSGIGTFPIQYIFGNGSCIDTASQDITVFANPLASFAGVDVHYCEIDPVDNFTGFPTDANGSFSGSGITDNLNGTATFDPTTSGLGPHDIIYTYTNANGCVDADTQLVEVGTFVSISGLLPNYCVNQTNIGIVGSPLGGTFGATAGLTDNLDGTAIFDPSAAGVGTYTISYTYVDVWGCVNTANQNVTVNSMPTPSIIDLDANYCKNALPDIISGNYTPGGVFSGDGITDNGNGTGTFTPSSLATGGPYTVYYQYTNPITTCSVTTSKQVNINAIPTAVISGDTSVCYGNASPVNFVFTGSTPYDFTYTNGSSNFNVSGHPANTHNIDHTPADTSVFTLVTLTDANNCSVAGTGSATFNIKPLTQITKHPSLLESCEGENKIMVSNGTGVNVSYQWQKNGVNIAGKTSNSLTFNNITAADVASYRVVINSECGPSINSNSAMISLLNPTIITAEPVSEHVCYNDNVNFSVTATGSNLEYEWYKDGALLQDTGNLSGTDQDALFISNLTEIYEGNYEAKVIGSCGTFTTNPALLEVDTSISITNQPQHLNSCPGENVSFSITATGENLSYKWLKNNVYLAGETNSTLILNNIAVADAASYKCIVLSLCGDSVTSNNAILTISTPTALSANPVDKVECEGNNTSFKVTATGSSLAYQWYKNGLTLASGGDVSGTNTNTLILNNIDINDSANYKCVVTGLCGTLTSTEVALTVDTGITIQQAPISKNACKGSSQEFNLVATGSSLSYQWQKDGVNIAGENSFNIVFNNVTAADVGTYRCIAKNTCGDSTISTNANLVLFDSTIITTQPTSSTICENNNVNFIVDATGTNLSFQWQKNGVNLANGGQISGSTSMNLSINNVNTTNAAVYSCVVTGSCGIENTSPANLTVNTNIAITTQPSNKTVCPGSNTSFEVIATGNITGYQWQKDGVDIAGETASFYVIDSAETNDLGVYRCIITGNCGTINSNGATLNLNEEISITTQPIAKEVCVNDNLNFSTNVTGTILSYQWRKDGVDLVNTSRITGTQSAVLSIDTAAATDIGNYTCYITGACNSIESNPANLTVNEDFIINTQPSSKSVCENASSSFSVIATGNNLTYQWQKDALNIAGETAQSIIIDTANATSAGVYRCIISGECSSRSSNSATLSIIPSTIITTSPVSKTRCNGNSVAFNVVASGNALSYQWLFNGSNLSDDAKTTGSTTSTLNLDNLTNANAGIYECRVSGTCNSLVSGAALLTLEDSIDITFEPENKTGCTGDNKTFTVAASGSNPSYQWQKDGVNIAGETLTSLALTNTSVSDNGIYRCAVSNVCGTTYSQGASLEIDSSITIQTQPTAVNTECIGGDISLSTIASGSNLQFQWIFNGTNLANNLQISGAQSQTLSISSLDNSFTGVYTCEVYNACNTVSTNPASLSISTPLSITKQPSNKTTCAGNDVNYSVEATGTNLTYQWQKDGVNLAGETNALLQLPAVALADEGIYRCLVKTNCDSAYSSAASLTIEEAIAITTQPTALNQECEGNSLSLLVVTTGTVSSYQWKKNGINLVDDANLSGSLSANLTFASLTPTDEGVYTCLVTGTCTNVTSAAASVLVDENIAIINQPTDYTVVTGGNANFSVTNSGDNPVYQWYKDGAMLIDGGIYSGSNTATLNLTGAVLADEGFFHVEITGTCNSETSNPANLDILLSSIIVTQPLSQNKCAGESVTLSIDAPTATNYQWKRNGVNLTDNAQITGATTATLIINNLTTANSGAYTCLLDGTENSSPATLKVFAKTTITTQPQDISRCIGDDASLSLVASGDSLEYQWYKDGLAIADGADYTGTLTNTLYISNISTSLSGTFYCVVTGECGFISSDPAVLSIYNNTNITTQPLSDTICETGSITIGLVASGDSLKYQWKKDGVNLNDVGNIFGSSSQNLVISNSTTSDAGIYSCDISGVCGSEGSDIAILKITPIPSITSNPADATRCENENVSFTIIATGDSIDYQWEKDGVALVDGGNISGVNTPFLNISSLTKSNQGAYRCVVSDNCTFVNSEVANLTVNKVTNITSEPTGDTICAGESTSFSIVAEGDNLSYQWLVNGTALADDANITGSNSPSLFITSAATTHAGSYTCQVQGDCYTVTSALANLIVNSSTEITSQPNTQPICEGENFKMICLANGVNLSYQWKKDNVNLVNGASVTGVTTNMLDYSSTTSSDAGSYTCVISGTCGTVTSDPTALKISTNTNILIQPLDDSLCVGENLILSITAEGDTLNYQWQRNGVSLAPTANISGTTSADLYILDVKESNTASYSCSITGTCGSVNSNPAIITVEPEIKIITQPTALNKCIGDQATFIINTNSDNYTYQWQKNGVNLANGATISGVNTKVLDISSVVVSDGGTYTCLVMGSCDSILSSPAPLVVNTPTSISSHPQSDTICEGASYILNVVAAGSNLNYYWYKDGVYIFDGLAYSGSTTNTVSIASSTSNESGIYSCTVSGSCGTEYSNTAKLLVNEQVSISTQPISQNKCTGDFAVLSVTAETSNPSYQWEKDGVALVDGGDISGATASLLSLNNLTSANSGGYRCVVTGSCGSSPSMPGNLTVSEYPDSAGIISGLDSVCQGDQNIIYSLAAVPNATSYVWNLPPGAYITNGDGTRQVEVNFETNELGGSFSVYGTNTCGSGTPSPIKTITASEVPIAYAGENRNLCIDTTQLLANTPSAGQTGVWSVISGPAIVNSINLPTSIVKNLRQGTNVLRWTISDAGCSNYDEVTISNNQQPIEAGEDTTLCDNVYTLNATAPSFGTGEWSILKGSGFNISTNNPTTIVSGLATGQNIFKWSGIYNGCISYDTVIITNDLPNTPDAGADQVIKQDFGFLNAESPSIGTGEWSLLNGSANITDRYLYNSEITGLSIGENTFKWTVIHKNCILFDTVTIENATTDSTDAGPNQTICTSSASLSAKDPYPGIGEWSVIKGSATFTDYTDHQTVASNLAKGENILLWTQNFNGLTTDSVKIFNNSPTTANAGLNLNLCADSVQLSANSPIVGTGVWSVVAGAGAIDSTSYYATNVSGLASGENKFKWTITNSGCTSSSIVTITNNIPSTPYAGEDITTCSDTALLNASNPSVGTGEWSVIKGAANFENNVAKSMASDTNLFVYSIIQSNCTLSDTVMVVCNKPTTASTGLDRSICTDSVTLNANTPTVGTGQWSTLTGSGTFSDLTDPGADVTGLSYGTNTYKWTISYLNCVSSDNISISNDYVLANAGPDQDLCTKDTYLEGSDPLNSEGYWSIVASTGGALINDPTDRNSYVENLGNGVNVLRWTVSKKACSSFDEVNITNNLPSDAYAGEDKTLCVDNTTLNAIATTVGSGYWTILTGNADFADSTLANTSITNLGLGTNILRWTTINSTCFTTDDVTIKNNQPINVYAGEDQDLCADSATLYAYAPSIGTGQWSLLGGYASFEDKNTNSTKVSNLGYGINRLLWTVSTNECSAADTVIITNNLPSTPNAGANQTTCNSSIQVSANQPAYGTGQWSLVSGTGLIEDNTANITTISDLGLGINSFSWTITNVNCTLSDIISINNNSPSIANAGNDIEICGDSARLNATEPSIGTGYWEVISGEGNFADYTVSNTLVSDLGFGVNTLRYYTSYSNCISYDDVSITNNKSYVNAGRDSTIYQSELLLIGNNTSAGTGAWNLIAGSGDIQDSSSFETTVLNLGSGANTFSWSITNNNCTATDEIIITYKPLPIANFKLNNLSGCEGTSVSFTNTTVNGTTYNWNFGDGVTSTDNSPTHQFNNPGKFRVTLTAYGPDNINDTKDTIIDIFQFPEAVIDVEPDTVYAGKQIARFYNYSINASSYEWDYGDGHTSTEISSQHSYTEAGEYIVKLKISSFEGCVDSTDAIIVVVEDGYLFFPNAFTPNPNGSNGGTYTETDKSNDVFRPHFDEVDEYQLQIFSRWGVLLFESDQLNIGWDGYYLGELLEEDVYVWKVSGTFSSGTTFTKAGTVLLIRD